MNRNPLSPLGQRTKNDPQVIGREVRVTLY